MPIIAESAANIVWGLFLVNIRMIATTNKVIVVQLLFWFYFGEAITLISSKDNEKPLICAVIFAISKGY